MNNDRSLILELRHAVPDAGLNATSIRDYFDELAWQDENTLSEAREEIRQRARQLIGTLDALAGKAGCDLPRVYRNLLACSSKWYLPPCVFLLEARALRIGKGSQGWRRVYAAEYDRLKPSGIWPLVRILLSTDGHPHSNDFLTVPGISAESRLAGILFHTRSGQARKLDLFATYTAAVKADDASVDVDLGQAAEIWKKLGLGRVPIDAIARASRGSAIRTFSDPSIASALLLGKFERPSAEEKTTPAISSHPTARDGDSRAAAAAMIAVGTQMQKGTLAQAIIVDDAAQALLATPPRGSQGRALHELLRGPFRIVLKSNLPTLLRFLAAPLEQRLQFLTGLPKQDQVKLIGDLRDQGVQFLWRASRDNAAREALVHALLEARKAKWLGQESGWRRYLPNSAISSSLGRIEPSALWDEIVSTNGQLKVSGLKKRQLRELATWLSEVEWTARDASHAVRGMTEPLVETLHDAARQATVKAIANLLHALDSAGLHSQWETVLNAALAQRTKHPAAVLAAGVSTASFRRLLSLFENGKQMPGLSILQIRSIDSDRPAWETLVADAAKRPKQARRTAAFTVPAALQSLIERDRKALLRAAGLHADAFGEIALARLPLREVVAAGIAYHGLGRWLDRRLSASQRRSLITWVATKYSETPTLSAALELAVAFSLADAYFLRRLAAKTRGATTRGRAFDDLYHTYELPKRSGGLRLITAPSPPLKRLQRRIYERAFQPIELHEAATGFRVGHSIVENASRHTGKALVVNVDLDSFFATTSYKLILRACGGATEDILSTRALRLLADICSYNGALPTGAPSSPAIANIVMHSADAIIAGAAARYNITYSRYADDLTFSGDGDVHKILPFVRRVVGSMGYRFKERKVNLFRRGRRQVVTGLVVNVKPNVPKRQRKLLRAAVHRRANGGTPELHGYAVTDATLLGHISHLATVQPAEAATHRAKLAGRRAEKVDNDQA